MILCAAVFFGCDKNVNKDYFKFASENLEMTVGDAEYLVWDAEEGASVIFLPRTPLLQPWTKTEK